MITAEQIQNTEALFELWTLVDSHLHAIGEYDRSRGESFAETAGRIGGDRVLEAAEKRWFEFPQ